jgi:hypothetical protein
MTLTASPRVPLPNLNRYPSPTDHWRETANLISPHWLELSEEETRALARQVGEQLLYPGMKKEQDAHRTIAATQTMLRANDFYPILCPPDHSLPPVERLDANGTPVQDYPRRNVTIPEKLLPTFADRFHLNFEKLLSMLCGGAPEYRGYERWNHPNLVNENTLRPGKALGQPYDPRPQLLKEKLAKNQPDYLERRRESKPIQPYSMTAPLAEEFTG